MANQTPSVRCLPRPWKSLASATLFLAALGTTAPAFAQEPPPKTFRERAKEYWDKVVSAMESSTKSAGDEYHKLKADAAHATGPAREKLADEMEALGKKWAAAREKLAASIETHMHSVHDEIKSLEEKTSKATGPAREKMSAEMEKLHEEWDHARAKMGAALSSNMKAAHEEYAHLKERASETSADAKAKLAPRMEKLKAEWAADREKLSTYLKADLKRTEEDMHKLGEATSNAAKSAKEKLMKKYHELRDRSDKLAEEKSLD